MAAKERKKQAKTENRRVRRRRKWALGAFLMFALCIGGFFGWMHINACAVRLEFADVYLPDLPAQFDGARMLFLSDLNIASRADAASCMRMMDNLAQLEPQMLVLGGDYSAGSLIDRLNGREGDPMHAIEFISSLDSFPAPLGKFAVLGENDGASIRGALEHSGVQLLEDACASVTKDGAQLVIAGLRDVSAGRTPYEEIGGYFNGGECVIAVAHNPTAYVGVRVAEAKGGGAWADMVLSGHTLGGQINLLGRNLRSLPEDEAKCIGGWYYGGDLPLLVSQGVGCRDVKLRLGSRGEIWCITLRRPRNAYVLPDL